MRPRIFVIREPSNAESIGCGGSKSSTNVVGASGKALVQARKAVVPRNLFRISNANGSLFILQMKDQRLPPRRLGAMCLGFQLLTSSHIHPEGSSIQKS